MLNTTQIYGLVNTAVQAALGQEALVSEDFHNLVSVGAAVFNADKVDVYSKALVNRIGQEIFVDRVYKGQLPKMMRDGWEYGSVLQKTSAGLPIARVNESYELKDGQSYDPHIFYKPKDVVVKLYNDYVTFSVDLSYTEQQLKDSFTNYNSMSAFIAMLFTQVENAINEALEQLCLRTIGSFVIDTVADDYQGTALSAKSGTKAINLLYLYNKHNNTALTADACLTDPDFVRFASYMMKMTHDRMRSMNSLYNIGKQPRHTPHDDCFITLLADFKNAADIYLQSTTFHNEMTALPEADVVAFWQGTFDGTNGWDFGTVSKISGMSGTGNEREVTGVLGVMYDRWACGVFNLDKRVTSDHTANAEFFTNFYKQRAMFFNDENENFVVFFVA